MFRSIVDGHAGQAPASGYIAAEAELHSSPALAGGDFDEAAQLLGSNDGCDAGLPKSEAVRIAAGTAAQRSRRLIATA